MAKIKNANPRGVSGAYNRLFGNSQLGMLISKVQSTVISAGSELERIIHSKVRKVDDLDSFLQQDIMPEGVFLATKQQLKKSEMLDFHGAEPDFIIFKRRYNKQSCHIVELKDGHVFDTKKASAERQSVHRFVERNGRHLPYVISIHFCAFNQNDRQTIWEGFKKKINYEETMTGREFCTLLEIDYDEIVEMRKRDAEENVMYFINELLKIPKIRQIVESILNQQNQSNH